MRRRLCRLRKRRTKLRANWCDRIMNDEDSDSDDDAALARVLPKIQTKVRRMMKHHLSYNMRCRPRQVFSRPPMLSPLQELDEYEFINDTRFTKGQFSDMLTKLSLLPRKVVNQGNRATVTLGLFTVLP